MLIQNKFTASVYHSKKNSPLRCVIKEVVHCRCHSKINWLIVDALLKESTTVKCNPNKNSPLHTQFQNKIILSRYSWSVTHSSYRYTRKWSILKELGYCRYLSLEGRPLYISMYKTNNHQSQHSIYKWILFCYVFRLMYRQKDTEEKLSCKNTVCILQYLCSCWDLKLRAVGNTWWVQIMNYKMCM
jgi:hypothetical protein